MQKYLAQCGVASRRKCEELILQGRVQVNGGTVTELGTKINPEKDKIKCALKLINTMIDEDSSIITIITGEDVTEAERDALKELVQAKVGDMVDVDVKVGLQPVYSFIIGIE